ncbi:MAG TPA: GNAT family N-acetyltransferase [Pyrinomonadaceae bacterium]|jgi:ribosomal protein S18 acetylase RimI-like enzyme
MPEESTLNNDRTVRLRPVVPQDASFLLRVYASTRAEEMARVSWDDEQRAAFLKMQFDAQLHHYQSNFPNALHDVIQHAGRPVGRLYVLRTDEFIRILDITILPEFRNAGLGTPLIQDLMKEAARSRRPLRIYVESFNPSLRLFERLGFRKAEEQGMHFLMEWNSSDSSNNSDEGNEGDEGNDGQ